MPISEHLLTQIDGLDLRAPLTEWSWLMPTNLDPFLATAFGDVFLRDEEGRIFFLDTLYSEFKQVATSKQEFENLCEDREFKRKYFQSFYVIPNRRQHGDLRAGECYSCKAPPTLGGQLDADDFERTDLITHLSVLAQVQRQTKNLPAGTKVTSVRLETVDEDKKSKTWWQRLFG